MTPLNSKKITLCSDSVDGGSICLWVSVTPLNSEEVTLCSDSVDWGVHLPLVSVSLYMHWYFLIFSYWTVKGSLCAMTVLTGGVHLPLVSVSLYMHWYFLIFSYWTVKRSLCAMTVLTGGVHLPLVSVSLYMHWYFLMFSYWTVKRSLCAMTVLTGGVHLPLVSVSLYMHWYFLIFSYWTVKRSFCAMTVLTGGSICLWCLYLYICTGISLYFLISWLFWMGCHLHHWTAKSSLCALAVSNGGKGGQIYPPGVNLKIWAPGYFRCAHQKGLFALHKTNNHSYVHSLFHFTYCTAYHVYTTCSVRLWPAYHVYCIACCWGDSCIKLMTALCIHVCPSHINMFIWYTTSKRYHAMACGSEHTPPCLNLSLKSEQKKHPLWIY